MSQDILIVDDESDIRELVSGILEDEGYATRTASDGISALESIKQRQPNLVVLDVWLGDGERDGLKILDIIKRDHPYVPVIMISGHSTIETAVSAIKKGAYDFIEKPFQTERLLLVARRAIESSRLKRENDELRIKARVTATALIGNSSHVTQLRQTVEKSAQTNGRVFITGPLGCGKESIAREIHLQSKRAQASFCVVNCGAMHPTKLEADLLGTEIVNHDSNQPRKIGILEQAHGGTIYFDEITQLPLPLQSRLVKILQEQAFTRVGGSEKLPIDVRFIAGTSDDVQLMIQEGNFREDLYYRLSVTHVMLPALKDRVSDIPIIAQRLMDEAAAASGMQSRVFAEDAIVLMQSYNWPGDLQQMRNVIDWLLIMLNTETQHPILASHLPLEIINGNTFVSNWQSKSADIVVLPLREAREAFEREYLLAQVNRFSGNISQTARFIGMERSALHRKLRALGVHDLRHRGDEDMLPDEAIGA
ncbi:MAG: sigma-54 dependent transcriptional regulator [Candidatus Paracaedibacteraceae bacterium]|nr:sigma-54 dependent transcriptional regulator [Candidatus Paracaedibacteraceae bacterium]